MNSILQVPDINATCSLSLNDKQKPKLRTFLQSWVMINIQTSISKQNNQWWRLRRLIASSNPGETSPLRVRWPDEISLCVLWIIELQNTKLAWLHHGSIYSTLRHSITLDWDQAQISGLSLSNLLREALVLLSFLMIVRSVWHCSTFLPSDASSIKFTW